MGWASYCEDIIQRYHEEMNDIKGKIEEFARDEGKSVFPMVKQAESLIKLGENLLDELNHSLELMTDPELDLTKEYERLQKEVREKNIAIATMNGQIETLLAQHQKNLNKMVENFNQKIIKMANNREKEILEAKKEAVDEAQRLFIEFGDEFRDELGF